MPFEKILGDDPDALECRVGRKVTGDQSTLKRWAIDSRCSTKELLLSRSLLFPDGNRLGVLVVPGENDGSAVKQLRVEKQRRALERDRRGTTFDELDDRLAILRDDHRFQQGGIKVLNEQTSKERERKRRTGC